MVSDRQSPEKQHQGRGKIPIRDPTRSYVLGGTKRASIWCGSRNVMNARMLNDLETFLRRLVTEELERQLQGHLLSRERVNEAGISGAKPFKLCFLNKVSDSIFSRCILKAENNSHLQIALIDARSGCVVREGLLSSLKVEICALNGHFGSDESEHWTNDEFNANIAREREGKQPLLVGKRFITLENGVACIENIIMTDNSRPQRSRKFRLGAKAVLPNPEGENIQEARSEPFVVRDNRGESYKKHYPPSLNDEIWRLNKIAKEKPIHNRLASEGIHTVKDLMRLYTTNESSLHKMFGKIQKKLWVATIEHAKTCVIDDYKLYYYHSTEPPIYLLFNSIYILVGVTFDWENYYSPDTLPPNEKYLVEKVKQDAYKNVTGLRLIDETKFNYLNLETCLKARQFDTPNQAVQHITMPTTQDQPVTLPSYSQPLNTASNIEEGMHDYQIYVDHLQETRETPLDINVEYDFSSGTHDYQIDVDHLQETRETPLDINVEYDFSSRMLAQGTSCDLNGSQFSFVQGSYGLDGENSGIHFINGCPSYTTCEPGSSFVFGSSVGAEFGNCPTFFNCAVNMSSTEKPNPVWCKILVALKWVMSVKRVAAARKNAKLFYCNC